MTKKPEIPDRFAQRIPEWVWRDPKYWDREYWKKTYGLPLDRVRWVYQCAANTADKPIKDPARNMRGAFGSKMAKLSGMVNKDGEANTTFWRCIKALEAEGYLVCLSRGGGKWANVYGLPIEKGSLDSDKVERRKTKNGKGGSKPKRYRKAQQAVTATPLVCQDGTAGVPLRHGKRARTEGLPCHHGSLPNPTHNLAKTLPDSDGGDVSVQGDGWEGIPDLLITAGCESNQVGKVIQEAREAGADPPTIHRMIEDRPDGAGFGLMRNKLKDHAAVRSLKEQVTKEDEKRAQARKRLQAKADQERSAIEEWGSDKSTTEIGSILCFTSTDAIANVKNDPVLMARAYEIAQQEIAHRRKD